MNNIGKICTIVSIPVYCTTNSQELARLPFFLSFSIFFFNQFNYIRRSVLSGNYHLVLSGERLTMGMGRRMSRASFGLLWFFFHHFNPFQHLQKHLSSRGDFSGSRHFKVSCVAWNAALIEYWPSIHTSIMVLNFLYEERHGLVNQQGYAARWGVLRQVLVCLSTVQAVLHQSLRYHSSHINGLLNASTNVSHIIWFNHSSHINGLLTASTNVSHIIWFTEQKLMSSILSGLLRRN
ncbi:LOW QUALITY PROTEIN: hypothetical protein PanWU01x14_084860 [Parasponia andersonii]|uniref:Uncharacterized protein n=1 Tax=Parasponia andersonii TaxID=3476 RepID=A0A2P5D9S1_PARAD|nr:LOW QUALITY PROTEIN: hypothetical protein PanWU01x14_084860 [Parasponia andersonii]